MTTLRQAAAMALDALEWNWGGEPLPTKELAAINALRKALAEPPTTKSQALRNIYEIWAGSEGIPEPETAVEAYLLRLIEQMRDEASKALAAHQWVGLTDEEVDEAYADGMHVLFGDANKGFARAIEAKLLEKNRGK